MHLLATAPGIIADGSAAIDLAQTPGDIVVLHDPQTAGLARDMVASGMQVVWRCHVGIDAPNETDVQSQVQELKDLVRQYAE